MVAHAIAGSGLWQVEPEPQRACSEAIAESIGQSRAQAAFAEARQQIEALLGASSNDDVIDRPGDATTTTATIFARLFGLPDDEVLQVLACVMADSLEVGTAILEAAGNHLRVDMGQYSQPDDVFFDLLRGKAVVNAILAEIAGKAVADQNVSQKVATQKKIIQDSLAGTNGRQQVEGWLPGYLAFPFRAYTEQGGGRIEAAWQSVAVHIQSQ